MAILRRFWSVLKANLNHLIGRAEDPEKMLNQMLLDMQEQLVNAKRQVVVAIADEKRLQKQLETEQGQSAEWEQRAMLAVRSGDDNLAKQALDRKAEHDQLAQGFAQNWTAQKAAVEQLKVALQKLSDKIEDAKRKKNLLVARAKRAEAQQTISATMSGISDTSALDTMDRMEEKITRMESEAQATTEMAHDIVTDDLKSKFDKLDGVKTDDALLALKAKMGLPTPRRAIATVSTSSVPSERQLEAAAKN